MDLIPLLSLIVAFLGLIVPFATALFQFWYPNRDKVITYKTSTNILIYNFSSIAREIFESGTYIRLFFANRHTKNLYQPFDVDNLYQVTVNLKNKSNERLPNVELFFNFNVDGKSPNVWVMDIPKITSSNILQKEDLQFNHQSYSVRIPILEKTGWYQFKFFVVNHRELKVIPRSLDEKHNVVCNSESENNERLVRILFTPNRALIYTAAILSLLSLYFRR